MKRINKIAIIFLMLSLFVACKAWDKYAGDWYGVTRDGQGVILTFSKNKTMTVISGEEIREVEVRQLSSGTLNEERYFGLEIEDEIFYLVFKDLNNEKEALFIKQTNDASDFEDLEGEIIFHMNREEYP